MNPGRAVYIGGGVYRRKTYGSNHPLAIPRVSLTTALIQSYGGFADGELLSARKAADFELEWFHTRDYVSAYKRAEALGRVNQALRSRHRLGTLENPYFEQFFTIPATATGASIQAAEQVIAGRIAFNPAGGMHHARADEARGFCYFNDPVLGILRLRQQGWRVLYVDIDAHHGDGVEAAFLDDPEVFTLSLHMDPAWAYPFTGGALTDTAVAATSLNVPLPRATHDAEYRLVWQRVWPAVVRRFAPDAIVLQAGTDAIGPDPLGKFRLTTQFFLELCADVLQASPCHADGTPRLLVTGGGGYHPLVLARAWTGLWAQLSGRELPAGLPPEGAQLLREAGWDQDEDEDYFPQLFISRFDAALDLPVRDDVRRLADQLDTHPFLS
jgi:acetoin utilization protein AcuC